MVGKTESLVENKAELLSRNPRRIRQMFEDIAPSYDFLNHFLSANRDRAWRRQTMRLAELRDGDRVLDVCTGTGDLAFEAARHAEVEVLGTDFCPGMVRVAREKMQRREGLRGRARSVHFSVADTLRLPFADSSFDIVTVGFGIRNVADLRTGLTEMRRVLRPGGRAFVLEFASSGRGPSMFRRLFDLYFHHVLPRLGRFFSSAEEPEKDDAYSYLPDSVARFPSPPELSRLLEDVGFENVKYRLRLLGVVAIHWGQRKDGTPAGSNSAEALARRGER